MEQQLLVLFAMTVSNSQSIYRKGSQEKLYCSHVEIAKDGSNRHRTGSQQLPNLENY